MRIAYIGRFAKIYDEEYIARSFESLGHEVLRIADNYGLTSTFRRIVEFEAEIVIFAKLEIAEDGFKFIKMLRERNIKTVCWLFDLYFGYPREHRVLVSPCFRADYVFTTDGGHEEKWKALKINHQVVRQGIYKPECELEPLDNPHGVVFVGGANPIYPKRLKQIDFVRKSFSDFRWFGQKSTDEMRGYNLNKLYATAKIAIGDSVYSPSYWSNRIVETLGRGGFFIHQDVPGLKEEYPHLVTYETDNVRDLREKIDYFLEHEEERQRIIAANFAFVKQNYTMEKKCAELLGKL